MWKEDVERKTKQPDIDSMRDVIHKQMGLKSIALIKSYSNGELLFVPQQEDHRVDHNV